MEFPHLGKHCSESSCKQLDFLPMKCDACQQIFCKDHIMYEQHKCPESYKKDNQVPVCPLCNIPIPVKRGEPPDIKVGQHIDTDCQSDPAKEKRKIYTNRCRKKGCKTKELIPFHCDKCQKNFCLKHRNELDHECKGFEDSGQAMSRSGAAALFRLDNKPKASSSSSNSTSASQKPKPQQTTLTNLGRDLDRERRERSGVPNRAPPGALSSLQGHMTEEEAMARAVAASMQDGTPRQPPSQKTAEQRRQEEEDMALAHALAASEEEARRSRNRPTEQKEKSCAVS